MSVFDPTDNSKLSQEWIGFLGQSEVNCPVTVVAASSGSGTAATSTTPNLVCKSPQFWNVEFDTAEDNDRFQITDYNVGGSVILAVSSKQTPSPTIPQLDTVLTSFGLIQDENKHWASGGLVDIIITNITNGLASLQLDTTAGARNAMWLTPGQTLRTDTALTFDPVFSDNSILANITRAVLAEFNLGALELIESAKIFLQRTCYGIASVMNDATTPTWIVTSTYRLTFRITFGPFWFWITYQPNGIGMSLSVTQNLDQQLSTQGFWSKLDSLKSNDNLSTSSVVPVFQDILEDVTLLNFSAGKTASNGVWWRVNVALQWKRSGSNNQTPVQIYLSYDSQTSTFSGGLITAEFYITAADKLLPTYDPGKDIEQPSGITIPDPWDITQLSEQTDDLPRGVPTSISLATIEYVNGDSNGPGCLSLFAQLVTPKGKGSDHVLMPIVWDELDIELYKGSGFMFSAGALFTLNPPDGKTYPPADLGLNINYDSTAASPTWQLMGYVDNLYLGLLWQFFDAEYQGPILSALGKLEIVSLQVMYTYSSGLASSFCFSGVIALGPLELRMFYQYASSVAGSNTAAHAMIPADGPEPQTVQPNHKDGSPQSNWFFECDLEALGTGATIGSIISAIADDAVGSLPSFVSGINIPTAGGRNPVSIKVAKTDAGQILFVLRIVIEEFTLSFIQVAPKDKNKQTKRLLRFAVDKIPLIEKIPLLDTLQQPFDQLEYYWVNGPEGFLLSEVTALNATPQLLEGEDVLLYKEATGAVTDPASGAPAAGPIPDTVVIQSGHHFVVVQKGAVAIDHIFNATDETSSDVTAPPVSSDEPPSGEPSSDPQPSSSDPAPSAPSKGAISFTLGPLTISAVTLQYKEHGSSKQKILSVVLDATFKMGPMTFSLLGFSLGVPLSGTVTLDKLSGLADQIDVSLQGLALSFNNPPLLLAGTFEHQVVADGEIFMGGLGISFPPYTFVGLGEYKILNNYKSVFVYAKLDGRKFLPLFKILCKIPVVMLIIHAKQSLHLNSRASRGFD